MERHNWLVTPREGEDSDRRIPSTSGAWNHGRQVSSYGLKKACVSRWILTGAARDGGYAVNLKLIARGNWRNVGVIGYQIGRKLEIKKKEKKCEGGGFGDGALT